MSVDTLGTSWDQCRSMVQYSFMSTETRRLVRTDSPGRPPRLQDRDDEQRGVSVCVRGGGGVTWIKLQRVRGGGGGAVTWMKLQRVSFNSIKVKQQCLRFIRGRSGGGGGGGGFVWNCRSHTLSLAEKWTCMTYSDKTRIKHVGAFWVVMDIYQKKQQQQNTQGVLSK